jgi:hypothetical protein
MDKIWFLKCNTNVFPRLLPSIQVTTATLLEKSHSVLVLALFVK